jgi:hypothetical protein
MRLPPTRIWVVMLATMCGLGGTACHETQSRDAKVPTPTNEFADTEDSTVRDASWHARAAVVNVDPGNSLTNRRSESTFSTRTSRASIDSHTSSLLVQVAALSQKQPLIEQQLRDMGLQVIGKRRSKLRQPNDYNVLVEDVTYVDESERMNARDSVAYTIIPTVHVRVISANERTTIEGTPIAVKLHGGNLSPTEAETYGRRLASARAELGKQLVHWLEPRVHLPASPDAAAPVNRTAATKPKAQAYAHNTTEKR